MVAVPHPTTVSSSFVVGSVTSNQGIAFAVLFASVEGQVNVTDRANPNDSFSVSSSYPDDADTRSSTGTGADASTGKLPLVLGPTEANPVTFNLSKDANSPSSWANYKVSWACTNNGVAIPANELTTSPDGLSVTANVKFSDGVVCRATVESLNPGLEVKKTADPASGTAVKRGDTVTYTVVAENTGETALENVNVTDDLTGVFDDADLVSGSLTATTGAAPTVSGDTLSWTGNLAVGASVTLSYQVKVKTDSVTAATLINKVIATGTVPGGPEVPSNCVEGTEVDCTTTHPVTALVPGLAVKKTADPASGTAVKRGDTVTYTVVAENTGETALENVNVTDDLTGVFDDADLVSGSLAATTGAAPSVSGDTLSWTGNLAVGASVTLSYQVKVKTDSITAATLINKVIATGTVPGGPDVPSNCVDGTEVDCTTTHPVTALVPGLEVKKTADPASGTAVKRGDTVTYTVVAENTGDAPLTGVTVTDNLADVFDDAAFVSGSLSASAGDAPTLAGNILSWTGDLAVGEQVTLTYQVKVNADAANGAILLNKVVAAGEAPGGVDVPSNCSDGTEPDCTTTHPTPATSLKVEKTDNKTVVGAGEALTYDVTVTNTGADQATGVKVTDLLPAELTYVSATDGGLYDPALRFVAWDLGTLAAGESKTVHVTATVNLDVLPGQEILNAAIVDSDQKCTDDPATPGVDECKSIDIDETPSVSIKKDDGKVTVVPGQELTYGLTASNTGKVAATDVTVTDQLPAELVFVSADQGGVYDAATGIVTWNIASLDAGNAVTVNVTAKVAETVAPGTDITNIATIDTPVGCIDDPATVDVDECKSIDPDHTPAISIVKDDHKTVVSPGEELTYDLLVKNTSKYAAKDVVVTDVLPANLTFVSATAGGVYDDATRTVSWNLGTMTAQSEQTVQVVATVSASALRNEVVSNTAKVTTEDVCVNDPATDTNECESTDIDVVPAVSITKDDGKLFVRSEETLNYVLTAKNTSDVDAPNVVVTDVLPKNVSFVKSSIPGTQSVNDPYSFEWDLGTLKAGESRDIVVTVKVLPKQRTGTLVVNTATITTDGVCIDDPATEVNECKATDVDEVTGVDPKRPGRVWILKDDHKTEVKAGEELTYDLTIGNNSTTSDVVDAVVTDNLPANATFVSATDGGVLSADGKSVTWRIAELAPGAKVTVKITVKVAATAKAGDEVINTAKVDIPGGCTAFDDCETEDRDVVPKLTIEKTDHQQTATPGEKLTYDVTVTNQTDVAAEKVVVTDRLPANVTFVSATDAGVYDQATRTVTWPSMMLAGNATKTVKVTVTVSASATGSVTNVAQVTTPVGCSVDDPCESTDVDTISPLATTGGAGFGVLGAAGVLLLAAGAVMVAVRRRKNATV
jgi:uncharacterized repeat protein (TIGR01451 family)/fimbrial isopeptide formation D2 family protein/LPXTG-motif cell wall-anchored protein